MKRASAFWHSAASKADAYPCVTKLLPVVTSLLVASLVLQVAGFVTPGWLVYSWEKFDFTQFWVGLWYQRVCHGPPAPVLICETRSLSEPDTSNHCYEITHDMTQYQVETTLALVSAVVALVFHWGLYKNADPDSTTVRAFVPLCLISGILAITAAGTALDASKKGARLFANSDCTNPYKVPYSPIITCVGGVCILVAGILFFLTRKDEGVKKPDGKRHA